MKTKLTSIFAAILCIALCLAPLASCDDDGDKPDGTTAKPTVTTLPDTSAPDTNVPDTSAPDTNVPDTSAPDTDVPGTSEPTTEVPETSAPETSTPDTNAPETSAPETSAPETSAPETSVPDTNAPETSTPDTDNKPTVDKAGWENMLSDKNFENYTITLEGRMTVTQDGQDYGTSDIRETMKITADKVEVTAYSSDVNSPANDSFTIVLEGDDAKAQKDQVSQIFLTVLSHYESFVYDPLTGNYTVPETLTIETVLIGITHTSEGEIESFEIPATLVIREAVAAISADGKLLTFECDYTQTMNMGSGAVSTSGKTTWTFSDYGTTVIE